MKTSDSVEEIIAKLNFSEELYVLRSIILSSGMEETVKWGIPVYTYEGHNLAGIAGFRNHFGLWFYQGSLLSDKKKKLVNAQEGKTKTLRQWRMTSVADIDRKTILAYLREAIANEKAGRRVSPKKPISIAPPVPKELKAVLETSKRFAAEFNRLTPGRQKEYADYINEAKQAATKNRRLEKIRPLIIAGKGLNDKYMK